jgi:hypothetical protein
MADKDREGPTPSLVSGLTSSAPGPLSLVLQSLLKALNRGSGKAQPIADTDRAKPAGLGHALDRPQTDFPVSGKLLGREVCL